MFVLSVLGDTATDGALKSKNFLSFFPFFLLSFFHSLLLSFFLLSRNLFFTTQLRTSNEEILFFSDFSARPGLLVSNYFAVYLLPVQWIEEYCED